MKKVLICLGTLAILAGCDMDSDKLSCTSTTRANGLTTKTTYDVKYNGDDIKYVTITYDYIKEESEDNEVDGTDADTDGLTEEKDNDKKDTDDTIDGEVGDAIDTTVDAIGDTIKSIKDTLDNQMNSYNNIEGFKYNVKTDTDEEYKVVYELDLNKINDSDLTRFNIDRDFSTFKSNYEDSGYTCK